LNKSRKNVVLVTGPPNNGRDDYLIQTLPKIKKKKTCGYYHIFKYMQRVSPDHGIPNLTRENVFSISKNTLDQIRDAAFTKVIAEIQESNNDIEIVSTPAVFKVQHVRNYYSGTVDGIKLEHLQNLKPKLIVIFVDDLLRVHEKMKKDPLRSKMNLKLRDLAEWTMAAIQIVNEYIETSGLVETIIFAKEHKVDTFVDLILGEKPRIYLSYHITGETEFHDIERFIKKVSSNFVCIDPYTIKDWEIVMNYDKAIEQEIEGSISIKVDYRSGPKTFENIPMEEIEQAIDLIRSQIVERDLLIISNAHATVVYHKSNKPSYGVMVEVFHSSMLSKPVYVLYPFKTRPSPFFEHFVTIPGNIIRGTEAIEALEDRLTNKMKDEYKSWPTWNIQSAS